MVNTPVLSAKFSLIVTVLMLSVFSIALIKLEMVPHIPVLFNLALLFVIGLWKKMNQKQLMEGITKGVSMVVSAIILFILIGITVASWMAVGTIPFLLGQVLEWVSPQFFFVSVLLITSVVGVLLGSSLTTVATMGVIFVSIAEVLGLSLPITVGAIVSGAFFGDKMSPLSDTTSLASSTVGVDLFEHIKSMMVTTVPAFFVSVILFLLIPINSSEVSGNNSIVEVSSVIKSMSLNPIIVLLPLVVLLICTVTKQSGIISLFLSSLTAIVTLILQSKGNMIGGLIMDGYVSTTGQEVVDSLLTRGGINSMMFTISLVILVAGLAGLSISLGIIKQLSDWVMRSVRKRSSVVRSSLATSFGLNFIVGEQYLSILLTGQAYQQSFEEKSIDKRVLARVMEDGGTVINPLVPWSVCGIFISNMLGVPTLAYVPFSFFCIACLLISFFLADYRFLRSRSHTSSTQTM
ncbi:Na+/H+ antiporter NhaC family protein [Mangrovibacillus cuniculi]|uniref:Na+/H+ antiporter NhaC n=1 Tax=Mangrovibacillus cuniculi TaxID=2593652 RepID=A0A7S8C9Y7_9BACI|nr:Na+/H+ antiporter NhaC family protein [Mangrovibacillus cuniculi]QPC46120.1 Na+/H+ antiporter NhaC [Mangrovibacillus cuniculi]